MNPSQTILDNVILSAIKTATEVQRLTGRNDVIICKATLPLIIIDVSQAKTDLVEIEIKPDKDSLGWLYTQDPKTNVVFICKGKFLYTITLEVFKKHVEKSLIDSGRQFSDFPEAGKMYRTPDGRTMTYLDKEPLLQPSTA
jgi:hypothetical protein